MTKTKWAAVAAALIVILLAVSYWVSQSDRVDTQQALNPHRTAPAFTLKDTKGVEHTLESFKGTAVLLHFWATWCPPCLDEMPKLVELARSLKGRSVKIVAISLDDKWEDAEKILKSSILPENFISLIDLSKEVPDRYG